LSFKVAWARVFNPAKKLTHHPGFDGWTRGKARVRSEGAQCGDPLSNDSEACVDLISWTHLLPIWDNFCNSKTRKLQSDRRDLVSTYLYPPDLCLLNILMSSCVQPFEVNRFRYPYSTLLPLIVSNINPIFTRAVDSVQLRDRLACTDVTSPTPAVRAQYSVLRATQGSKLLIVTQAPYFQQSAISAT